MITSKTAVTTGSVALALLFGGGIFLYLNLGSIAERLAENVASRTLGVNVGIGRVDISLQDMKIDVHNITIANPDGYQKPHALTVQKVSIQAEEITQELLNFSNAQLSGMQVYLEVKPDRTNLSDIRNNIAIPQTTGAQDTGTATTKVIVQSFLADQGKIHPSVTLIEGQDLEPVNIPDIRLTGIGEKENGVLAQEAIAQIWRAVSGEVIRAANQQGFLQGLDIDALRDAGISRIDSIKDEVRNKVDDAVGRLRGVLGE